MADEPVSNGVPIWLLATSFEHRGTSLYTLGLARHLCEFGFAPTIICQSSARIPADLRSKIPIHELAHVRNRILRYFGIQRLKQQFQSSPPALIHAQHRSLDTLAVELAQSFDRPYVQTIHDTLHSRDSLTVLPEKLGAIIAVSPSVERDLVMEAAIPDNVVRMIPNGVELPASLTLPPPRPEGKIPVVGTASPLEPVKGLTFFLMAAELILSSGHDVEFLVAGTGPDEETLRRAAQLLDIANRVTFIDYAESYTRVLNVLDVFVIPSLEQGLGTVMFEAMALGKPVVATRVGGIADFFVDGEHALLVPEANHIVLADKITKLLDNPGRARKLAVAGQQLVRTQFSVNRMTRETADLYRSVLEEFHVHDVAQLAVKAR